ncbi:PAS domain S-box-containing protein [Paracoccus aminovorans]|uniref:histidine kinase n=1 Tax=Paracoccus aminovorans TaxID=34004 RepID=A0A1I3DF95_9RHOB|nr:PAS domain-containing protein [Paracoccus aminovorans]CQR84056.1 hypothetical protein JCM7685_pAMV3p0111 [Paracoccus aminovorans]SFH85460.1 PAS domain S-box-containing protein [Paracoccus aminovorans]
MRLELLCTTVLGMAFLVVLGVWGGSGLLGVQLAGLAAIAAGFAAVALMIVTRPFAAATGPPPEPPPGRCVDGWADAVLRDLAAPAAILDPGGAVVAANAAFLAGVEPAGQGIGLPVWDRLDADGHAALAAALTGRSSLSDVPLRLQGDATVRMSLTPVRGGGGFCLLQATAPPGAPAEAPAAECDSRMLIDCIEEIVFSIDAEGRLIFLNASWERLLDHALPDSLGRPLIGFVHPEYRPVAEAQLTALARGKRDSCHVEARITAKNGAACWMVLRARPMAPAGDGPHSAVGTLTDISRMKRTEASLRANRRSLSMLLSNVPGMVYRCRHDRNWSFDFASDGCVDVTGYEPYEIVGDSGLSYIEIVHPDDRAAAWEFVRRQVVLRRKFQLVYRIVSRPGQVRWVWEQGKGVFSSSGEILALEGFITVIAEEGEDEIVSGLQRLLRDRQLSS